MRGIQDAAQGLAARVRADAAVNLGPAGSKQKRLSTLIDAKKMADIKVLQGGARPHLRHMSLQTLHGARA